jgi:NAD(P)-dependent dehydrogenase (short-subunit alcohol dehydrogenase family)
MTETKKICIVTGSNSGIGKQAAAQVAGEGYHVILACRSEERGREALAEIMSQNPGCSAELMQVDMGLQQSVRDFATKVKSRYTKVDVLIHNAAVFDVTQKEAQKNSEGIETVWSVNHLGPVLLTELLLEPLKASENGRVITVSSQGLVAMPGLKVDLSDPEFVTRKFSVTKAYYQSKRAQVMYTFWLADRLADTRVTCNSIRVTAVKVDLARHPDLSAIKRWAYGLKSRMALEPEEMARTYTWLATSAAASTISGKYFNEKNAEVKSCAYASNRENINAVMALTARYIPELREVVPGDGATAD